MTGPRVGVLGGTFDPIHYGHLAAAEAAQDALHLDRVRFLPAARPPHRADSPRASGYHRLQMVSLAAADARGWEVSDLELRREGPSFTFDTLSTLQREGFAATQLFFITGADAFAEIRTWHRYPDVLDAAHFVVVTRPGVTIDALRQRLPDLANRMIDAGDASEGDTTRVFLVAADTPDVSSTEIRRRVAQAQSIAGLVPAAVAAYIDQNFLYRTASEPATPLGAGA